MLIKFKFISSSTYLKDRIKSIAKLSDIDIKINHTKEFIIVQADENDKNFINFTKNLDYYLYNSLFLEGIESEKGEIENENERVRLPLSIGVCNRCSKEMLDEDSKRYYYPFTSCNSCSNQYAFFDKYPFKRENSFLAIFQPCPSCGEELKKDPFREDYPLISCLDCNIPIRVVNKKGTKEFWANEKEDFKKAFELTASAIKKGERVAIKTLNGFKTFYKEPRENSKILITNLDKAKHDFLLLKQEINALFSVERPIIYATTTNEELKKRVSSIVELKAFDDGFTLLLAKELTDLGYVFYEEGEKEYELKMDFLLEINVLKDIKLFMNKGYKLLSNGERVLIPKPLNSNKVAIYKDYVLNEGVLDKIERFEKISAQEVYVFKDEEIEHPNIKKADVAKSAFLSVLRENDIDEKSVGVYFGDEKIFLYYNKKEIKRIFDFGEEPKNLIERIRNFREGSDKLVDNYIKRFGSLDDLEKISGFFERAAFLIGIDGGFKELNILSMNFGGKGGLSVDCRIIDDRFSYEAFYASIMSYRLGETDKILLCYSIFESLGDFLSNTLNELGKKLKAKEFAICGKYITNSALFSRFARNIPKTRTNREFSVDEFNLFYGI